MKTRNWTADDWTIITTFAILSFFSIKYVWIPLIKYIVLLKGGEDMIIICMVVAILFIYWIGYQHGRGVREELIRETERIIRRQGLEDKHKITALKSIWRINKEG